jgi:hypothetical protein
MGRREAGFLLKAAWRAVYVGSIATFVLFLACGVLFGGYGFGVAALATPLVALPAGLFAFLWALRPEASEKD